MAWKLCQVREHRLEEFRTDLAARYGIAARFRRRKDTPPAVRSRINWVRALDGAMARCAAVRLQDVLGRSVNVPETVAKSVLKIAGELSRAEPVPNTKIFHLNGLAQRVASAVAEAELAEREKLILEKFRIREAADNERRRLEQRSLDMEMQRIQKEAERKLLSPLARTLISNLNSHDLISPALNLAEFPHLAMQAFDNPAEPGLINEIEGCIAELRAAFNEKADRQALTDADIVALLILAALIADGFEYNDNRGGLSHLFQIRQKTAVFIDEVQDFAEVDVVLMGLTASGDYNQITLAGDRCQRLHTNGAQTYDDLFPLIPRAQHNPSIFLEYNFRQRPELALLSAGFRALIQKDSKIEIDADRRAAAAVYKYSTRERMAGFILDKIRQVPPHATVAVIMLTIEEAKIWFDLLEDDLASYHRAPLISQRDDLTRRFRIHFTEVRETKGLEFNVVIVPDIGSFALDSTIGQNQAYVAISRAKHSLILGCNAELVEKREIAALQAGNLIHLQDLPSH